MTDVVKLAHFGIPAKRTKFKKCIIVEVRMIVVFLNVFDKLCNQFRDCIRHYYIFFYFDLFKNFDPLKHGMSDCLVSVSQSVYNQPCNLSSCRYVNLE